MTHRAYYFSKVAEYVALPDALGLVTSVYGPVLNWEVSGLDRAIPWDYTFTLSNKDFVLVDLKLCSRAEEFGSVPLQTALEGLKGLRLSPRVDALFFVGSTFVYLKSPRGLAQCVLRAAQEGRNSLPLGDLVSCAAKVLPARKETSSVLRDLYWKILHS